MTLKLSCVCLFVLVDDQAQQVATFDLVCFDGSRVHLGIPKGHVDDVVSEFVEGEETVPAADASGKKLQLGLKQWIEAFEFVQRRAALKRSAFMCDFAALIYFRISTLPAICLPVFRRMNNLNPEMSLEAQRVASLSLEKQVFPQSPS